VDTKDELLARILGAAAHIKKDEIHPTRTKREFANCVGVDGGIFEHLFRTVNMFVNSMRQIYYLTTKLKLKLN
jgi:hypothetical protein